MKTTAKTRFLSFILAALFFCTLTGYTENFKDSSQEGQRQGKRGEGAQKMIDELGLTSEQQEQMKEQRRQHSQEVKSMRTELKTARESLKEELDKYDSDVSKINSLASEIKTLEGIMVDSRIEKVLSLKEILTEEQYKKFREKTQEFHKNRKNKRFNNKEE